MGKKEVKSYNLLTLSINIRYKRKVWRTSCTFICIWFTILTHYSYFTYFYSSKFHAVLLTPGCISTWSFINVCYSLCNVINGDIHNRHCTSKMWVMLIHQVFGIGKGIKNLRDVCINGKPGWSPESCKTYIRCIILSIMKIKKTIVIQTLKTNKSIIKQNVY